MTPLVPSLALSCPFSPSIAYHDTNQQSYHRTFRDYSLIKSPIRPLTLRMFSLIYDIPSRSRLWYTFSSSPSLSSFHSSSSFVDSRWPTILTQIISTLSNEIHHLTPLLPIPTSDSAPASTPPSIPTSDIDDKVNTSTDTRSRRQTGTETEDDRKMSEAKEIIRRLSELKYEMSRDKVLTYVTYARSMEAHASRGSSICALTFVDGSLCHSSRLYSIWNPSISSVLTPPILISLLTILRPDPSAPLSIPNLVHRLLTLVQPLADRSSKTEAPTSIVTTTIYETSEGKTIPGSRRLGCSRSVICTCPAVSVLVNH